MVQLKVVAENGPKVKARKQQSIYTFCQTTVKQTGNEKGTIEKEHMQKGQQQEASENVPKVNINRQQSIETFLQTLHTRDNKRKNKYGSKKSRQRQDVSEKRPKENLSTHQSQQKMFQSLVENANMGKTEDRHIHQV